MRTIYNKVKGKETLGVESRENNNNIRHSMARGHTEKIQFSLGPVWRMVIGDGRNQKS